jgi:predicted CoA-binding protein
MIDDEVKEILSKLKTVAVVGISPKQDRPSYLVATYLQSRGYRIIPVRPDGNQILGEKVYHRLADIPGEIGVEVIDIFRRSDDVPPIVEGAIRCGAKVVWMQEGVINEEAAARAEEAGLKVVMDRCMKKEHERLLRM